MRQAVRAIYRPTPTHEECLRWGLTVEEASGPPVEVWPDLMPSINVFSALQTQWRAGMGGATGLDYGVIPAVLRLMGLPRTDWPQIFADLRTLEDEALVIFREQQENKK